MSLNNTDALVVDPNRYSVAFVSEPMDMPNRPDGAYIRLTVGNRDVPTYVVRRSPTGNWGFLLESCWGLYASFELPRNRASVGADNITIAWQQQGLNQAHMPINAPAGARMRLRRTREDVRWVNVNGIESDEEDGVTARGMRKECRGRRLTMVHHF